MTRLDAGEIKRHAAGRWPEILADLAGIRPDYLDGRHHPCPRCGGKDRFRLLDAETGAALCNQCMTSDCGDGLGVIRQLRNWTFPQTLEAIASKLGMAVGGNGNGNGRGNGRPELEGLHWDEAGVAAWTKTKAGITVDAVRRNGGQVGVRHSYGGDLDVIAIPIVDPDKAAPVGHAMYRADGKGFPRAKGAAAKILSTRGAGKGFLGKWALEHIEGAEVVWKVEGCSDMLALSGAVPPDLHEKHIVLSNPHGSSEGPRAVHLGPLKGKDVIVVHDTDSAGRKGARKWANAIAAVATRVRILDLPVPEGTKGAVDIRDLLVAGYTYEDLLDLAEQAAVVEPEPEADVTSDDDTRPEIDAGEGDLARLTDRCWEVIRETNDPPTLFRFAGRPTRIEPDDEGAPVPGTLDKDRLREHLARVARWVKPKETETGIERFPAHPPVGVVTNCLATPEHPLPVLRRIVEAPIVAPDGSIRREAGYDSTTRAYVHLDESVRIPEIPVRPTRQDIERAKGLILDELLIDFPFDGVASRANAVACLILPAVRELIRGPTPLHLVSKPDAGTGSGLLVDCFAMVCTGRDAPVTTEGRDADEWRKRLTSALMNSPVYIFLDNLHRRLDSASLAAAITCKTWTDRILGATEQVRLPVTACWVAAGNNPVTSKELARRTVPIRMDAKMERPWERPAEAFKHPNLLSWAQESRGELLWSILTLARAWVAAGRPSPSCRRLGTFEQYSEVIGGILETAGIPGFLGNLADFYDQADEESQVWRAFLSAWWDTKGPTDVGVQELWALIEDRSEIQIDLGRGSERSQRVRLGKRIASARERVYTLEPSNGGTVTVRVESAGTLRRAAQWRLTPTEPCECGEGSECISPHPSSPSSSLSSGSLSHSSRVGPDIHKIHNIHTDELENGEIGSDEPGEHSQHSHDEPEPAHPGDDSDGSDNSWRPAP